MEKTSDISGQRFGPLVVIGRSHADAHRNIYWKCVCDCGSEIVVRLRSLKTNSTTSCGCVDNPNKGGRKKIHGMNGTPEHAAWCAMITRCENQNDKRYHQYGGRGIRVCERWRTSFQSFYTDMGPRPSSAHSIDRINNDGNYDPGNCRWADRQTQGRNRSNNHRLEAFGCSKTLIEWSETTGINAETITWRIKRGWDVEKALTERPKPTGRMVSS